MTLTEHMTAARSRPLTAAELRSPAYATLGEEGYREMLARHARLEVCCGCEFFAHDGDTQDVCFPDPYCPEEPIPYEVVESSAAASLKCPACWSSERSTRRKVARKHPAPPGNLAADLYVSCDHEWHDTAEPAKKIQE